ncbi:biotin--[acetyl-CoA-carboxylase] ligase [Nesterenkonia flava]|uniref:biotin--[biotin carboxyl-carrier protein] ligase n=1 Tax=Nesterenkonia flava TaxID=469799 RepID=A0ABU1FQF0_9MICC|nr:biotin--[acetyl-CoA-carboxylase] ligase [Nesterenkonia flava]MDR5710877.1 biotin--[acetyl-CoA-carboxylase] ligase [Nesterenkonia flava]
MSDSSVLPPLDDLTLQQRLVDEGPVSRLVRVESIGSTTAELLAAAEGCISEEAFASAWPHFSVLTAEEQTGGRGRLGRAWSSPKGASLSTSIVLRPHLPRADWSWLTMAAACALVEELQQAYGVQAGLKWPNDVHIEGAKIAGLLAVMTPRADAVILGCGINVLLEREELPTTTSTSLLLALREVEAPVSQDGPWEDETGVSSAERGSEWSDLRTELLSGWLLRFHKLLAQSESAGGAGVIRDRVAGVLTTLGQYVRVELPDRTAVRGTAVALEESGALTVKIIERRSAALDPEAGGGEELLWRPVAASYESFSAGDVVHLRRADQGTWAAGCREICTDA